MSKSDLEAMDKSTAFAFMSEAAIYRKAVAKDIESLKRYENTKDKRDILIDIEILWNDYFGLFKKEYEVLEHAEAKDA